MSSAKLSQVTLNNVTQIRDTLSLIHRGKVQWATFGYAARDQIKFLKTGNGLENLAAEHPEYDVVYAVVSQVVPMDGNEVVKNLLVTMVGENCSGIKKARSAAHRGEFGDYVIEFIPLSSHFQANDPAEICVEEFFSKLRIDPSARAKWKRQQGEKVAEKPESGITKLHNTNFGNPDAVKERLQKAKQIAEKTARNRYRNGRMSQGSWSSAVSSYSQNHSRAPSNVSAAPSHTSAEQAASLPPQIPEEAVAAAPHEELSFRPEEELGYSAAAADNLDPALEEITHYEVDVSLFTPGAPAQEYDASPAAPSEEAGPVKFCGECGVPLEEGCRFCGECGTPLE